MLKALILSRMQASFAAMANAGKGRKRKKGALAMSAAGMVIAFLIAGVSFLFLFGMMAQVLCEPMVTADMEWLYFAMMAITGIVMACFMGVFMAQAQLFEAKDNELLLSMPIPPSYILGSRMISLYLQNFVINLIAMLPAGVIYAIHFGFSPLALVFYICSLLLLPILSLILSCVLGWVVALISSKMRNKTLVTMVFSIAFLVVYFYGYSRISEILQMIVLNSGAIGQTVQTFAAPLYWMGLSLGGNAGAFLCFCLSVLLPFALVYYVLARSFIKIATTRRGAARVTYRERTLQVASPQKALLRKEFNHYTSSATYMLNSTLGSAFLLIAAVAVHIKGADLLAVVDMLPGMQPLLPALACVAIAFIAGTNIVTAPSISLEGKYIWHLQCVPVSAWQVLNSKLQLHMILTLIPTAICSASVGIFLRLDVLSFLLVLLVPLAYAYFAGAFGLIINLLSPKLDWVNEAQAVKQSASTLIAMFGDWGIVLLLFGLYILTRDVLSITVFLLICALILALFSWLAIRWLKTKGAKKFESL